MKPVLSVESMIKPNGSRSYVSSSPSTVVLLGEDVVIQPMTTRHEGRPFMYNQPRAQLEPVTSPRLRSFSASVLKRMEWIIVFCWLATSIWALETLAPPANI
jgi:hypothetical protein